MERPSRSRANEREPVGGEGVDDLFGRVYSELKGLASSALRAQRVNHTLQPTALVHEAWLKMFGNLDEVTSRAHFLAIAAKAMRQVLQDHARKHLADKRGERAPGVQLVDARYAAHERGSGEPEVDLIVLNDALSRLAVLNQRHADIAELRILGGLTMKEVADSVGVSLRTVELDWTFVRAWLRTELAEA